MAGVVHSEPRPFAFPNGDSAILDWQTEHAMLFGLGSRGNVVLRELAIWRQEWAEHRDTVLPKFIEAFPGRRPAAAYICGELPLRPLQQPLPMSSRLRHERCVYVIGDDDGFMYCDFPEPYQRDEAMHLYQNGIIDREELRAYRGYSRTAGLAAYRWEMAQ
jgi:hypothetical protein